MSKINKDTIRDLLLIILLCTSSLWHIKREPALVAIEIAIASAIFIIAMDTLIRTLLKILRDIKA